MCNDYKNRCADCSCLIEKDGEWFCDEANDKCGDVEECPEGVAQCTWCEEYYCDSDLHEEIHLGLLCDRCMAAIQSRGEKLIIKY